MAYTVLGQRCKRWTNTDPASSFVSFVLGKKQDG